MSWAAAQRTAVLAGVALVAAIIVLSTTHSHLGAQHLPALPRSIPVPGTASGWYEARVASYGPSNVQARTSCGERFTSATVGIAHPVLGCGVKLYLEYGTHVVLTQVVDRGPAVAGRTFDVTKGLADKIGLRGTQFVRWRYAR